MRSNSSRSLHQEPPAQQGPFWMGSLQQQHQQGPPPAGFMVDPWSGQPVMMGQPMAMGQPAMRRSMHELGSIPAPAAMPVPAFFAPPPPPPPPQLRTSSPSATSQTSEWSRVSEAVATAAARQPHKSAKGGSRKKRPKRFNKPSSSSRPHSRSHSRNSQRDWNEDNYPRSEVSDKGNSAEERDDMEVSNAAVAKAEPVWMCEHCTYANGADLAVCQMCAKTAAVAPKGGNGKERKQKRGKRPSSSASAKSAVRRERTPAAAKGSRAPMKSPAAAAVSEEEDDTEQDVRRAYYAVRRSAGGKMMERGGQTQHELQTLTLSFI